MFAAGDTDSKKTSSQQFAAQIKQLEIEGSKLVAATDMLSDSLGILGNGGYAGGQASGEFGNGLPLPTSLSALTDISAEQRTISELSLQLDSQSRETERLQRQLYDDATGGYRPVTSVRSALADLEIPITSHMSTTRVGSFPGSRGAETDFLATSHVERELRMTKMENSELQERLHELTKVMGQQKDQFRNTVEDLKSQLQDALHGRNSLLETKYAFLLQMTDCH
ncbi:hypothetical protein LSAT2_029126 [Lamellibrachia satsuma]|nr:hypothetical protein LSAT2_029126 [Lamellibrachia satsuma]